MAFGFFKKSELADVIYINGNIYTQDPGFPLATAVACVNGRVQAVGDFEAMDSLVGEDTEVIDLDGKFMFPGFIDVHSSKVLDIFSEKYLKLEPEWDLEEVLSAVSEYAQDHEDLDTIFGFGYNENILSEIEAEDAHIRLDEAVNDRSIILLGESCVHCWMNTLASNIVTEAAEEECVDYVSLPYILDALIPFDFDEIQQAVIDGAEELADKGITAIFNMCSPNFFDSLYQDGIMAIINESTIKSRFYGSLYANRPINQETLVHLLSESNTNSMEMGGIIDYTFLKLTVSNDEYSSFFSQQALNTICLAICDRGFNIHLDALDEESLEKAYAAFSLVRAKGYKKNTLVIASDLPISPSEDYLTTWGTDLLNESVFSHSKDVSEAIDNLTINAALLLGKENSFGSIESGKVADFTVFEENPLDADLNYFSNMHAEMVILDSTIVYDATIAAEDELFDLLSAQQL